MQVPASPNQWSPTLLRSLEWKRFEEITCKYYRLLGHQARTTGPGPDGGVDVEVLDATTGRLKIVVQCKSWNTWIVCASRVRDLFGTMKARHADAAAFFTTTRFSPDALKFGREQNMDIVDTDEFLRRITALPPAQSHALLRLATRGDYTTPTCVSCDVKMVPRRSDRSPTKRFWGCPNYPRCRKLIRFPKDAPDFAGEATPLPPVPRRPASLSREKIVVPQARSTPLTPLVARSSVPDPPVITAAAPRHVIRLSPAPRLPHRRRSPTALLSILLAAALGFAIWFAVHSRPTAPSRQTVGAARMAKPASAIPQAIPSPSRQEVANAAEKAQSQAPLATRTQALLTYEPPQRSFHLAIEKTFAAGESLAQSALAMGHRAAERFAANRMPRYFAIAVHPPQTRQGLGYYIVYDTATRTLPTDEVYMLSRNHPTGMIAHLRQYECFFIDSAWLQRLTSQ